MVGSVLVIAEGGSCAGLSAAAWRRPGGSSRAPASGSWCSCRRRRRPHRPPPLPGSAAPVRATDGWPAGAWHCWQSSGGVLFSRAGRIEPCARVAQGAVLGDRRVLPEQRAALFGMAAVAGLVDGRLVQHRHGRRAVRAVAVAAAHQAEAHRMRRRLVEVGALLRVAGHADLGLGRLGEHRVVAGVQLVAVGAGELVAVVRADMPGGAGAALVAAEARLVAFLRGQERARLEAVDRGLRALDRVSRARPVAGLALQAAGAERRVRIAAPGVRRLEDVGRR